MPNDPDQEPDPLEKSLGDQATGADVSRTDGERSLGNQSTTGDALSSLSDLGSELGEAIDSDLPLIDLAARYEIEGELGQGGMGAVLLATDRQLKRKVAIKRILGSMAQSKTALQRFVTEAQSIAKLNHFNIVQVHEFGRDAEGPCLVLEYVGGGSLLDKLKDGKLEVEEAVDITCQLCEALGKAHEVGIIHRDIKPANILLTEDGSPKLTDFGLARQESVDHGQTQAGAVLGTIDFMPPEQRRDVTATDARSDLWSLAATFYQLITGKSPKIIKFTNVPQALHNVLEKSLEDALEDRYQTAREFRDALRDSLATTAGPVPEVSADLLAGECAGCHTRNEASRKFCRECALPLRVPCLACEEEIPIWDKVCPECGGKQPELAAGRREEIDAQRVQAESLLMELAFDESLVIAGEIAAIEDIRLQHLKEWSGKFIESIPVEETRQQENAAKQHSEAQQHRKAFDYKSAIQAMETIPEVMRTTEMSGYLGQLQADQQESDQLLQKIQKRIKARNVLGIDELLNRGTELMGDRADLNKLVEQKEKLIRQRDKSYLEAQEHRKAFNYKSAIQVMEAIPWVMQTTEMSAYVKQLQADQDESDQLLQKIQKRIKARHEGLLQRPQEGIDELLNRATELLGDRADLHELKSVLIAQEEKLIRQRDEAYAEAEKLLDQGEAEAALKKIQAVKLKRLRSTDLYLKRQLETIAQKRKEQKVNLRELKTKITAETKPALKLPLVEQYLELRPDDHETVHLVSNLRQQIRSENLQRKKTLKATLVIATICVLPVALMLLMIGLSIDDTARKKTPAAEKAAEIAAALEKKDRLRVLDLDPTNSEALRLKEAATLRGHIWPVMSVAWSPDGKRIVSGSYDDNALIIWDANSGQQLRTPEGHTDFFRSVAFSPDGKLIVSGNRHNSLIIWDANSGQQLKTLKGHPNSVYSVAFSPDGKQIVSGSWDRTLRIWDANSGQQLKTLKGHTQGVNSVAWSPDGKRIVSGSDDETLRIWDASSGNELQVLKGHTSNVKSVAFSPDGKLIVSGSSDETVRIWDADNGQHVRTLEGHSECVSSVAFSPDGQKLVSGSHDMTLKIWDANNGKELHTLKGHTRGVYSVAFSPDGQRLVSGSSDKTLKLWPTSGFKP